MKKLLLKLIAALSLPIFLSYLYVMIFPMYYLNADCITFRYQRDYVHKNSDYNDVLIMGDSIGQSGILTYGIDNMDTYNIALMSATSAEMYIALRNYLENHDAPQAVIMIFSSVSLVENVHLSDFAFRSEYYSWSELTELYKKGHELKDPYWDASGIEFDILRNYLRDPTLFLPVVNERSFFTRYDINIKQYNNLVQHKGWMSYGEEEENFETDYIAQTDHFEVLPMHDHYIRQIIELCEENGIRIIIEQPPIKESSIGNIRENVISEYEGYYRELQEDHPYAVINPSIVYYSNEYFGDYTHLNQDGAKKFTEEIFDKYFPEDNTQL